MCKVSAKCSVPVGLASGLRNSRGGGSNRLPGWTRGTKKNAWMLLGWVSKNQSVTYQKNIIHFLPLLRLSLRPLLLKWLKINVFCPPPPNSGAGSQPKFKVPPPKTLTGTILNPLSAQPGFARLPFITPRPRPPGVCSLGDLAGKQVLASQRAPP